MSSDEKESTTQDGSGGGNSTQMDIQMLKDWKSTMEKNEFSITGDNINIDELVDKEKNQLDHAKILTMKMAPKNTFDLISFKTLIESRMESLIDSYKNENKDLDVNERVDILARTIVSCACIQYMTSMSVKELKENETYMFINDVINNIVMNNQIDVRKHVDNAIIDQRKINYKTYKLIILTNQVDENLIKRMSVMELKKQILNDAYSIIKENWNHDNHYMSMEMFKNFIIKMIKIRCESGSRNYDVVDIEMNIDKYGFDKFFRRVSEIEMAYDFLCKDVQVKEKPIKKSKKESKPIKKTETIKRSRTTNIPEDVFKEMKAEMITSIKMNKGSAKYIKSDDLAKESEKVIKYVKSLPDSDHLSNV